MHNLTYQERARFAYAAGNDELAEALEMCAEQEAIIERLDALTEDMPEKSAVMWLLMDHGLTVYQANPLADKLIALFGGE